MGLDAAGVTLVYKKSEGSLPVARSGALTKPFSLGKEQHAEAHAVIVITSLPAPWQGGVSGGDGVLQTHRRSTVAISLTAMMEICQISERQE